MSDAELMPFTDAPDAEAPAPAPPPAAAPTPAAAPEPPAPAEAAAPAEQAAAPDETAAAETPPHGQPPNRLQAALRESREREKHWRDAAQAGIQLAQRIQQHPRALAILQGAPEDKPTGPATPAPPVASRSELEDLAREYTLYTPQGQLDLEAATRVLTRLDQRAAAMAERIVDQRLAPLQQSMTRDKATGRRAEAFQVAQQLKIPDAIAQPIIDGVLASNPELLADQQTAAMTLVAAAGIHYIQQQAAGANAPPPPGAGLPTPPPPTYTETNTGQRPSAAPVSALEQSVMRRAGIKPKAWAAASSRYERAKGEGLRNLEQEND